MIEWKRQMKFFLKNRLFLFFLFFAAVLGYGYVLTHGTCGIDDISIGLYFEQGMGVAIGRWPFYLINKIIPIAQYTPFIPDLVTVLLLMLSAVVWCVLLRSILGETSSVWCYIVFVFCFLDYSMNADIFIFYLQNGLGWFQLFVAVSLLLFLYLYTNRNGAVKQLILRGLVIVLLALAISFYESAASLFLTGVFVVLFLELWKNGKQSVFHGKKFFLALLFTARYLIYAMVVRRIVRAVIMRVFAIMPYSFYRSVSSLEWLTKGGFANIGTNIRALLADLYCDYFAVGVVYYPILLFVFCTVIFAGALCYLWYRKRDALLVLSGVGVYVSLFVLSGISGSAMEYRACQNFVLFVAFVLAGTMAWSMEKRSCVRLCTGICIGAALLYSAYDMNQWFMLDYEKTEYEMRVIDRIAEELNSGKYNTEEKSVVFVGDFVLPDEIYDKYCITSEDFGWKMVASAVIGVYGSDESLKDGKYCYGQNQSSLIDWSVHAFAMYSGYNVPIRQLFEYRGYEFQWADAELTKKVFDLFYPLDEALYSYTGLEKYEEKYGEKAQYPENGYVEELEDCIVVRL